jgi:hypothetical protein
MSWWVNFSSGAEQKYLPSARWADIFSFLELDRLLLVMPLQTIYFQRLRDFAATLDVAPPLASFHPRTSLPIPDDRITCTDAPQPVASNDTTNDWVYRPTRSMDNRRLGFGGTNLEVFLAEPPTPSGNSESMCDRILALREPRDRAANFQFYVSMKKRDWEKSREAEQDLDNAVAKRRKMWSEGGGHSAKVPWIALEYRCRACTVARGVCVHRCGVCRFFFPVRSTRCEFPMMFELVRCKRLTVRNRLSSSAVSCPKKVVARAAAPGSATLAWLTGASPRPAGSISGMWLMKTMMTPKYAHMIGTIKVRRRAANATLS